MTVLYSLIVLAALLLATVASLPRWLIFPEWFRNGLDKVVDLLVQGPGDQYALMYTETAAASVRQRFADALTEFTDETRPDYQKIDTITVIAHSAGATVALGVLSDSKLCHQWTVDTNIGKQPDEVTFVTVGSSLTVSWENVKNHPMFQNTLPKWISWIDLWARYDPIPHGPPGSKLTKAVRGDGGGRCHFQRVVNYDNPLRDHSAYWGNHEEVVSRLFYEITGRPKLSSTNQTERKKAEIIQGLINRIGNHRARVGLISGATVAALVAAGILVGVARSWFEIVGAAAIGILPVTDSWPAWTQGALESQVASWLVGIALLSLAAYALLRMVMGFFGALLYKDPWRRAETAESERLHEPSPPRVV